MSSISKPYDNAKAESYFKTLKQEEADLKEYGSFADAEANLAGFIEQVYNTKRLHFSLGYLPPAESEATYISVPGSWLSPCPAKWVHSNFYFIQNVSCIIITPQPREAANSTRLITTSSTLHNVS
ncbi:MAG: transposase [Ktedonobacteraceae bacterium]|nr:transposase [Ktedonobacteraceae bacterium]